MNKFSLILLLVLSCVQSVAQLKSPSEFLGYRLGEQFTPYYRVLEYFNYAATNSSRVKLEQYGKSYEGRVLQLAFVGSAENLARLEEIRNNNLKLSGLVDGPAVGMQPVIVWLSYNVHGNEAVSTEAAMQTLYHLLNESNAEAKEWLQNTLVVIDPCMNPDGRERYVNFYNSVRNVIPDPFSFTREHREPWPGGRTNHYYFDLNRDWAWQSQRETQQRMSLYNRWLPQIHVDFHEQGFNEPYYFAPAAEPLHQDITKWQRDFQAIIGRNHAKYFDERGWLFFTKERFDLLYPSYGDTYPTYNGSVGMTYEQGGSGRAGVAVLNREGDTLTLRDRIEHHFTTGLSTIESASAHADKVIREFENYFKSSASNPSGSYKSYIIKDDNPEKMRVLAQLLQRNGISFGFGMLGKAQGFNYFTGKTERFSFSPSDMVISAHQPKSVLLKVLFEPKTFVADSVTYDITAWALPYAFGLKTYALKESIKPAVSQMPVSNISKATSDRLLAYAANWNSVADLKFLAALLRKDVRVRYSEVPFTNSGINFNAGSLIIMRAGNEFLKGGFDQFITETARKFNVNLHGIVSGLADQGPDLGSGRIRFLRRPRVAVLSGEQTSSQSFGEIWHFFEQQIGYPISVINAEDVADVSLYDFNVLIVPDGSYNKNLPVEKLSGWVNEGGKLILMEDAIMQVSGKKGFNISLKEESKPKENTPPEIIPYSERERASVRTNIPGAIFNVHLDNTHPLAFGYPNYYFTLKLSDKVYNYLNGGWNVGVLNKNSYVTGFVGATTKRKLNDGLLFGVQEMGEGAVVYLAEDLLFRGFWENGKLMFGNAVFSPLVP